LAKSLRSTYSGFMALATFSEETCNGGNAWF
jgi:hypothetical protein